MSRVDTDNFTKWSLEEVVCFYRRRFSWVTASQDELLQKAIVFGRTCQPPINKYYWTSIPRIVLSLSMFLEWLEGISPEGKCRVLDLGSCQPVAAFWRLAMPESVRNVEITYASMAEETYFEESEIGTFRAQTISAQINEKTLPFEPGSFDCVIFTEILEHLYLHPQPVLCDINRILKPGGVLILSTPNASSWKKIYALTNGNSGFDSPTFTKEWGHRYEYSFYETKTLLQKTGFSIDHEKAEDVYFDDPEGCRSVLQFLSVVISKFLTGDVKSAVKLITRKGSGLFFSARKESDIAQPETSQLMLI